MRRLALLPSLALASATLAAQSPSTTSGITTLAALRDTARVLLIFAPSPTDAQLQIQLRTLSEHGPDVASRDLVPIALPFNSPAPTPAVFVPAEAESARRRFGVAPADFAVILIGKDGGEKLRSRKPLPISALNSSIDSMPMRQREVQQRGR